MAKIINHNYCGRYWN